ncbi:MAG: D-alanine--D-alanine ligase [Planctomycetes bacterium]|nr:D-alanine--D-alanine ligase [Planctomycetota bacterium]
MNMAPAARHAARHAGRRRTAPLDVVVLAGGPGPERQVSESSGAAVHAALGRLGHRCVVCDITPADLSALDRRADFFFIALHGEFGEDGALQAELDRRGLHYSGSGAAASRRAMNKVQAKRCLQLAGIPTPEYLVADAATPPRSLSGLVLPAVVKPVASGSSVDTSIVRTPQQLAAAVESVAARYGEALVERYIRGPEWTVGILGGRALPVCEIRTKREFYDYQAKYVDDDTQYLFDLDYPAAALERVQALSVAAHRVLGCRVFSRVDWMLDAETLEPFVLEVNTIPGFTNHSLLPKAAARVGVDFDELCQRIIDLSLVSDRASDGGRPMPGEPAGGAEARN